MFSQGGRERVAETRPDPSLLERPNAEELATRHRMGEKGGEAAFIREKGANGENKLFIQRLNNRLNRIANSLEPHTQ